MRRAILLLTALSGLLAQPRSAVAVVSRAEHSRECVMCHITWGDGYTRLEKDLAPPRYDVIIDGFRERNSSVEMCWSCHDGFVLDDRETFGRGDPHLAKLPADHPRGDLPLDGRGEMYCGTCHTPHSHKMGRKFDLSPFLRKSALSSELCLDCHADHQGGRWNHPLHAPMDKSRGRELARDNAPAGRVECLSCHDFHRHEPVRGALGADRGALCSSCHANQQAVADTDHDLRRAAAFGRTATGRPLEQGDVCAPCHAMHQAPAEGSLAAGPADRPDQGASPRDGRCLACHTPSGATAGMSFDDWGHPLGAAARVAGDAAGLPLSGGQVACATCHDPHRWSPDEAAAGTGPGDEEGDAATSFLRRPDQGGGALCSACHATQAAIAASDHGKDEPAFQQAAGVHAWACTLCHRPHGTAHFTRQEGGAEEHSPATRLCLSCHDGAGDRREFVTPVGEHSHPVGVPFPRGGQPPWLHPDAGDSLSVRYAFLAGERAVGCESCHDPHRWSPVGLPWARGDNGGEGASFLRCDNRGGALCLGCHQDQAGLLGGLHDIPADPPGSRGPCAACHQPHQAVTADLFSRALAVSNLDSLLRRTDWPAGSPERQPQNWQGAARACLACHHSQAEGPAPEVWFHPVQPATPRPVPGGAPELKRINCDTCHDPHQAPGADRPAAAVHFLKHASAETVCADCHQQDALRRYAFFHDRRRRRQ